MAANSGDDEILARIQAVEKKVKTCCDLIPLDNWGFDDSIQEKLRQRKHRLVNQNLTAKEKKSLSNSQKQHLARSIGGVYNTVSDVLDWMSTSVLQNVNPTKRAEKPVKGAPNSGKPEKQNAQKPIVRAVEGSSQVKASQSNEAVEIANTKIVEDSSSDSEDETPSKPVAVPQPAVSKSDTPKQQKKDKKKSVKSDVSETTDSASTKRKLDAVPTTPAKIAKIDKAVEGGDSLPNADPILARQLAMEKLQQKLEEMKVARRGKKAESTNALKLEEERKMKRRLSKMNMKQRKAQEKGKTAEDTALPAVKIEPKTEVQPTTDDEGKVVYSKFDFIIKDQKKKLSMKEKRQKFTGRDYKTLINKVEKRQEILEKLKETNPEKAKSMDDEIKWSRAEKKAEGSKVKDNMELLKKGLKNKEKAKAKRLGKWEKRSEKVKSDKQERQDKRNTNIQKRKDEKKKRKTQLMRKKGRIL